jgi:REP element-mobilizing transposase RayT
MEPKHHRRSLRLPGYDYSAPGWYFITICLQKSSRFLAGIRNGVADLTALGRIADEYWRQIPAHYPQTEVDEYVMMPDHMHGILRIRPDDAPGPVGRGIAGVGRNGADKIIVGAGHGGGGIVGAGNGLARPDHGHGVNGIIVRAGHGADINNVRVDHLDGGIVADINNVRVDHLDGGIVGVDHGQPLRDGLPRQRNNCQSPHADSTNIGVISVYQHVVPGSIPAIISQYKSSVKRWCNKNGYRLFQWQRNYYEHIIRDEYALDRIRQYIRENPVAGHSPEGKLIRKDLERRQDAPGKRVRLHQCKAGYL